MKPSPFHVGRTPIPRLIASTVRRAAPLIACGLLVACGARERPGDVAAIAFPQTETAIDYQAEVVGAPTEQIKALMEQSLAIHLRRDDGAQSLALLRRRGRDDVEVAQRILRSFGYYGAEVTVEVAEGAPRANGDGPETRTAVARLILDPGPAYVLAEHRFAFVGVFTPPEITLPSPGALGSPVGRTAEAGPILGAERAAVTELRDSGRPWATGEGRRAIADPATATLEVESRIAPGPYAVFGPVEFVGLDRVTQEHLRSYIRWAEGAPVVASALREYQRDLMETELFAGASVAVPETPPEGAADGGAIAAPVIVTLEEGRRHSVTAGLRWNTDTGPLGRATYRDRNVFGAGERFDAGLDLGLERQSLRFDARKPQIGRPGQDLTGSLEFRNLETDAFDEIGATLAVGVERRLSRRWTAGAGGLAELAQVTDNAGEETVMLFGIPAFATYDGTDDPLNRTTGERAGFLVTPFQSISTGNSAPFLLLEGNGAVYRPLDSERRYVAAARGRLGTLVSESFDDIPAQRRLFSGGGGSVRGYQEQFIGPIDAQNDPLGGRSVAEVGLELRGMISGDIGGVLFTEAGVVSSEPLPDLNDEVQYAAGVGLRYFTPVGPIRLDVAFPLNPRDVDNTFEAYFSIGQAF